MLEQISKIDSQVLRALLVAAAGLIGIIAGYFGVNENLFSVGALRIIDAVLLVMTTGGLAYAAYARVKLPNPPLSDSAMRKTEELLSAGKLRARPTSVRKETAR